MVSTDEPRAFTSVGPGTAAQTWRGDPRWTSGSPAGLEGIERLVVVAAHPDDESLGAGGLVATATAAGRKVTIVCATDGEGSHPDSPTCTPHQLAALRVTESRRAAAALGVAPEQLQQLGLPDGDVAGQEEALVARVVEVVGDGRKVVVVAPWRRDGHPDHEAAGRAGAAAARRTGADLWEYPIWFWHWGCPDEAPWEDLLTFELADAALRAKAAAIGAHVSQVSPLSDRPGDETLLPSALLEHFSDSPEHYLRTASADCPDDALDRLHEHEVDPWGVQTRWYEKRKRDLLLAMLPRERFERTLELGCSTGALAEALAPRSGSVLAVDRSVAALAAAWERFRDDDRVSVGTLDAPREWPSDMTFDLVVVSEVGYFLSPADLEALVARIASSLRPEGVIVLCHWRHPVEGWVLDGEDVHAGFLDPRLPPLAASYQDNDVEIRVQAREWPDPMR